MFSGIIEEVGAVCGLEQGHDWARLSVGASRVLEGLRVGDSVSVNGACLTVTSLEPEGFTVGLAPETLRRTALGKPGDRVNLERAVRVGDRLGGHYVQGHVDGIGRIVQRYPEGDSLVWWFEPPLSLMAYIVEKGFVAVDGISLTVAARTDTRFAVALVAYTRDHVALVDKPDGDAVNIEVDVIAKYVESMLEVRSSRAGVA